MKTHRVLLVQGFRYALSGIKQFPRDAKALTREASLKLRGGGSNFLKLIYSAVFNDGKKLEG